MPDIILPGRVRSLSARPQSQSDPGLDLPDDVKQAMERQQRLRDATGAMTIRNEAMRTLRDGLDQRVDQADFADEAVRGDFGTFVGNTIAEAKKRYQGLTGAARLSDAAMGRLDGDLAFTGQVFRDRGATEATVRFEYSVGATGGGRPRRREASITSWLTTMEFRCRSLSSR